LCQTLTWYGMMRWRNPTFVTIYDSWHTRLPRWWHHHARICGGAQHPSNHHHCLSTLQQLPPS
jgi:hypothetical protein